MPQKKQPKAATWLCQKKEPAKGNQNVPFLEYWVVEFVPQGFTKLLPPKRNAKHVLTVQYTRTNHFIWGDPHYHRNTVIPVCHGSDMYSDLLSGTFFWHFFLARMNGKGQLWWNLELDEISTGAHWDLEFAVEVRQCPLKSGVRSSMWHIFWSFSGISVWHIFRHFSLWFSPAYLLTFFLAFSLACLLPIFRAYVPTFFLCIISGICCDNFSNILSGIFCVRFCDNFSVVKSGISFNILSGILTGIFSRSFLAFYLAYLLAFYLAHLRTVFLALYLAYFVTIFLTFYLAYFVWDFVTIFLSSNLAYLLTFFLAF